jgi:hypothetical protein
VRATSDRAYDEF